MTKPIAIRETILRRMRELNLSQNRLAKLSGMHQQTLNRYLTGQRDMTGELLERVFTALGIAVTTAGAARRVKKAKRSVAGG